MTEFRTIEIDFEIHKKIEMERQGFSESPNNVLRRLLGIHRPAATPESRPADGRPWSGKGVTLPHGSEIRMEYNGTGHAGQIEDGEWAVEGKSFNSPSAAAGGVARTRAGSSPSLDGWVYWQVKRPGDHGWIPINALRLNSTTKVLTLADF